MPLSFGIGLWRVVSPEDDAMTIFQSIANQAGGSFRDIVGARVVEFHPDGRSRKTSVFDENKSARTLREIENGASETPYDLFPTCLEAAPIYLPSTPRKRRLTLPGTRFDAITLGSTLDAIVALRLAKLPDDLEWRDLKDRLLDLLTTSYTHKMPFVVHGF